MRRHSRPTRRFAAMERRKTYWTSCKPAPICTSTWTITPTKPSWTSYSPSAKRSDGIRRDDHARSSSPDRRGQTQEIRGFVRSDGRQHGALHRRQDRQRPALPRLRHSGHRHRMRIRRDRVSLGSRETAESRGTRCLQGQVESASASARCRRHRARTAAGRESPHGRAAHGRIRTRLLHCRGQRSPECGCPRHRRSALGVLGLDAMLLAPLFARRAAYRRANRRRFDRRALFTPPAWAQALGVLGACRSEEHTSELQSRLHLVCRLLLEKKKKKKNK